MQEQDGKITMEEYEKALSIIEAFKNSQFAPTPLDIPYLRDLSETAQRYIDMLKRGVISDDDFKQQIFIHAIESIYGKNIWDWVNAHTKRSK